LDEIVFYRHATPDDAESLTSLRLEFLAEVSGADAADANLRAAILA
jgi:hypothetical protein